MKNLFFKPFKKERLAIIISSFIAISAGLVFIIFQATKERVTLTLDGYTQVVNTHADTVNELLDEYDVNVKPADKVNPSVDTPISNNIEVVWEPAQLVLFVKEREEQAYWTTAKTVKEFLAENEIELTSHDRIRPELSTDISNEIVVTFEKAFQITLNVGGEDKQVWSTSTTVADFLKQQEITLNLLDRVEPNLTERVKKDSVITVTRVEKVTDVVEEPVDYAVVTKNDSKLSKGASKVLSEGKEGLVEKQYEVILENGKEISRTLVNTSTLKESLDRVVAVGTKEDIQVSRGTEGGEEFYVSSTAYTASCNGCSGITSTGINLKANPQAKVIAVDPSVIPLGTKVYVEGYGYAVAGDVGSAIKGYKIDVFFPTKDEAYRWGNKKVKIRIIN
ncbi:ubiquitin-like domain-containing protein [Bacillus sp. SCS-151]|uniref:ubiquitin-like domain-containing protein n=1 Tax=Nanhaiella sioensis TaxID=3115293 RepID=UPI00397BFC22